MPCARCGLRSATGIMCRVAEQYPALPGHVARAELLRSGVIGTPTSVQVSSTHGYHAVALMRRFLGVDFEPVTVRSTRFTAPLVDPLTRDSWTGDDTPKEAGTTLATVDFGGGRSGLYDFTDDLTCHRRCHQYPGVRSPFPARPGPAEQSRPRRLSVPFRTVLSMAYDFQVTVDCADPHVLADWWAAALGWVVEPSDEEFIRRMIAQGYAQEDQTKKHHGVLVWKEGQAISPPDSAAVPPRRVLFQLVPEPKTVKNRLHFDVRVGPDNIEAELERLTAVGATFLHRASQGPHSWVTMTDPEGNEFCLS